MRQHQLFVNEREKRFFTILAAVLACAILSSTTAVAQDKAPSEAGSPANAKLSPSSEGYSFASKPGETSQDGARATTDTHAYPVSSVIAPLPCTSEPAATATQSRSAVESSPGTQDGPRIAPVSGTSEAVPPVSSGLSQEVPDLPSAVSRFKTSASAGVTALPPGAATATSLSRSADVDLSSGGLESPGAAPASPSAEPAVVLTRTGTLESAVTPPIYALSAAAEPAKGNTVLLGVTTVNAAANAPGDGTSLSATGTKLAVAVPAAKSLDEFPIVVDSDLDVTPGNLQEKSVWKEITDSPGQVKISTGTEFPVVSISCLTSKTAKTGDHVEARLRLDLKIGGRVIAPKGSRVTGHVTSVHSARRLLVAELKLRERWLRANGALGLQFDEILTSDNSHIPLVAVPARHARIVSNKNEGRILGVNHEGQIASPLSIQLKNQGIHLAIRAAAACGGVFSMGAVPVAFGVLGAIDPSFAFMHPVGKNVHHRRLKGFGMGVLSGLPGGFLVADFVIRGAEAEVKPGDEFLVSFKQDFTGRIATEAELLPTVKTKVEGEVLTKTTKKQKKKAEKLQKTDK